MKEVTSARLDYGLQTKDGDRLEFEFIHDADRENRGFVVDRLNAYIDKQMVGYIKVEYVGSDRFKQFYPSGVLNYIEQIGGSSILPRGSETIDLRKADPATLNSVAQNLYRYRFTREPNTEFQSFNELRDWLNQEAKTNRNLGRSVREFKEFKKRIDNPFVAFVQTRESSYNGLMRDNSGRGIATALYKVMALELDKRGMPLRSSTLQSPEATGIWTKFEREGIATRTKDKERLVLDPKKLDLGSVPSFAFI